MSQTPTPNRVGQITGDRLCTACGYNLIGQPVVREPHYDMLIVRCPECSVAAALQEYPLLMRWIGRWMRLLAALWIVIVIAAWFFSGLFMFGMAMASTQLAGTTAQDEFAEVYNAWRDSKTPPAVAAPVVTTNGGAPDDTAVPAVLDADGPGVVGDDVAALPVPVVLPPGMIAPGQVIVTTPSGIQVVTGGGALSTDTFWSKHFDRPAFVAARGGTLGMIDWAVAWFWLGLTPVFFILGCFWSIIVARRAGHFSFVALAIAAIALVFLGVRVLAWEHEAVMWLGAAAERLVGPMVMPATVVVLTAALFVGMLHGRRIARALARFVVPPTILPLLGVLWTVDDLEPPVPPLP